MRGIFKFEDLIRCIVAISSCGLIMVVLIHYIPGNIEDGIKIKWFIKSMFGICNNFIMVTFPLLCVALFFSFLLTLIVVLLSTQISNLSYSIKIMLTIFSCLPVFIVGEFFSSLRLPSIVDFIIAGLILGICDAFWIELYRHSEIEIDTVKNEPYVLMAKANGIKGYNLLWYMKNDIAIHFLKVLTPRLIFLISSAVIVEWIFGLPGIGNKVIVAVRNKNIENLMSIELFIVVFVILCSFLNRMVDSQLDPRLREEKDV